MPVELEGQLAAVPGRYAIVVARYNESITARLLSGAVETLTAHGVPGDAIDVAWVPGAFELPIAAAAFARKSQTRAVLCLGAVIRGETTHDEHINRAVSLAFSELSLETGVPVMFGVLTCNNLEQAIHRAGGNVGNKGVECAEAALRMAHLLQQLAQPSAPPRF
jgi:6,7-dimethyl-8-ribityllumazine synthase